MKNTSVRTLLLILAFAVSKATEVKDAPEAPIFSCRGRAAGYYADLETGCQDYHMCDASGRRYTYSCPNQTRFQQRVMICDHWFMVNCSQSESHFGANLLIGQKDRQFVEHFQQASGHNQERSYPSRSRAFYTNPSAPIKDDKSNQTKTEFTRIQPDGANDIKPNLLAKPPYLQSITKNSVEEKYSLVKAPETNRYNAQFSTPTGSIKPTTERSLSRQLANNPFFRSFSQAPSLIADKGEDDPLTFLSPHQRKDQRESSDRNVFHKTRDGDSHSGAATSGTSWTRTPPLSTRRDSSSFSTPTSRVATPIFRNTPSFPNYEKRRTSTLVTTAVPLTYDYNSVTPEGHSNHLQTETPELRNNFSKVSANYAGFTSEASPTTHYEILKTRERNNVRAPIPLTSTQAATSFLLNSTQGGGSYVSGLHLPTVTQGSGNVQRTPGGFRYTTQDATQAPTGHPASFSGVDSTLTGGGVTGYDASRLDRSGITTGRDSTYVPSGGGFPSGSDLTQVSGGGSPTGPDAAQVSGGGGFSTGPEVIPVSGGGGTSTGYDGSQVSGGGGLFTGYDASQVSGGGGLTGPDAPLSGDDHDQDIVNCHQVEVRIPDPRRMFFIPDSAAREAEMLNSNNETVLTISLPSERHHGAMRFKGVKGSEGRRADCPQCHPAFLLPGKCQPCVLIRR